MTPLPPPDSNVLFPCCPRARSWGPEQCFRNARSWVVSGRQPLRCAFLFGVPGSLVTDRMRRGGKLGARAAPRSRFRQRRARERETSGAGSRASRRGASARRPSRASFDRPERGRRLTCGGAPVLRLVSPMATGIECYGVAGPVKTILFYYGRGGMVDTPWSRILQARAGHGDPNLTRYGKFSGEPSHSRPSI